MESERIATTTTTTTTTANTPSVTPFTQNEISFFPYTHHSEQYYHRYHQTVRQINLWISARTYTEHTADNTSASDNVFLCPSHVFEFTP